MEGVTTAIVAFIFFCIAYPHLIKNRPQFYAALGFVLLVIFFDCIGHLQSSPEAGFRRFTYFVEAILQIGAILLLVMSTGGKTLGELGEEVSKTIDVVRRGGEKETIIVPLTGEQPRSAPRDPVTPRRATSTDSSSIPMD